MPNTPHLVYFFDEGFAECTLVSVYSVLANRKGPTKISLYGIKITDDCWERYKKLNNHFENANITFENLENQAVLDLDPKHLSVACYGSLIMPAMLDGRAIYIDGDTIVRRDIGELYNTDMRGYALAACVNTSTEYHTLVAKTSGRKAKKYAAHYTIRAQELGFEIDGDYFNAGMMLMDLDKIRETGLDKEMADLDAAEQFSHSVDQDRLNYLFRDNYLKLDPIWNSLSGNRLTTKSVFPKQLRDYYKESRKNPAILHFVGTGKPWKTKHPILHPRKWKHIREYNYYRDACHKITEA